MLKVFLGLREIAGYFTRLNEGLHALAIKSTFVNLTEHSFRYDSNAQWPLVRLHQYCAKRYYSATPLLKLFWGSMQVLLASMVFGWALLHYDVFVFGYGTSFLFLYDLPILKFFGKKVIFVFFGSDARPPYLNGASIGAGNSQQIEQCTRRARKTKRRIERIERYADAVLSHPPFGLFHQKPYILNAVVGFPFDFNVNMPEKLPISSEGVRILHSPSNPLIKGTAEIEKAVANLRARGHQIEWVTITGQPNAVVLQELARCDFIVDQLYSDWLMPGFATEAAALGKPTIIAGYELEAMKALLDNASIPPVHICHPDDIEAAIERLIVDKAYRIDLGQRAQAFVQLNWSSTKLAERFLKIITGDVPASWYYDPIQSNYIHGCGISEARLTEFLRSYINTGGKEALQLSDKPDVEKQMVAFSSGQDNQPN